MAKRVAAAFTAAIVFMTGCAEWFRCWANTAGNNGGYWDTEISGLRFSLVNESGDVEKIIDVFDYSSDPEYAVSDIFDAGSTVGDLINGTNKAKIEYRVFNQCKLEIANDLSYNPLSACIETDDLQSLYDDKWECRDYREVFVNSDLKDKFSADLIYYYYNEKNKDDPYNNKFFLGKLNVYDLSLEFVRTKSADYNSAIGLINNYFTGKDSELSGTSKPWLGVCDLLDAMGVGVYDGIPQSEIPYSEAKVYDNLMKNFVSANYCIVIEPITFVPVYLRMQELDKNGIATYNTLKHCALYYGSATELGLLEGISGNKIVSDDIGYYAQIASQGVQSFVQICLVPITRGLLPKVAYVTEEYAYDLEKYSKGKLKCINDEDWDYKSWEGELPEKIQKRISEGGYNKDVGNLEGYSAYSDYHLCRIYNNKFLKNYACAMTMITSSDFIKPQVEAQDYDYHTSTNVISTIKVSNRSSAEYTSDISDSLTANTTVNSARVPHAMLCRFVITSVEDESGVTPLFCAGTEEEFAAAIAGPKLEELGFAKGADGNFIYEFYGTLDGLPSRDDMLKNSWSSGCVSFEWKTPEKPCTVTIRAEFLDANGNPEPVLGTTKTDGTRETLLNESLLSSGRYATEFTCRINNEIEKNYLNEETVPPDSVSIISVKPSSSVSTADWELYNVNRGVYDRYTTLFGNKANSCTEPNPLGIEAVESLSWTDYSAQKGADGSYHVSAVPRTASVTFSNDVGVTCPDGSPRAIRTDLNGLYSPYAEKIGSGYGIGFDLFASLPPDPDANAYERKVTVNGREYISSEITGFNNGIVLFPEYNYEKYYGRLVPIETDDPARTEYVLEANENSYYYKTLGTGDDESLQDKRSRVHFTPIWYPDGEYEIAVCLFDLWTPVGELRYQKKYSVTISGSVYDTWYVSGGTVNQKRS